MGRMLPDLHQRVPIVRSELFFAVVALSILFDKLYNFCLLNFGALVNTSNKLNFYAYPFAMRLSPYKLSLFYFRLAQALYLFN